ncbi:hypothetical protein E4T39_02813 [Aureobasidium subglaciale]|nr:hypothetical protein E4T39_02813 [Aureobasidium subglaciale]
MPMIWNAAADAKLFTAVMAVYDVKISGTQVSKIAQMMGEDCTPKAITHRLSKLRSTGTVSSPSTSATPKTPFSSTRKTGKFSGSGTPSKSAKGKNSGLSATHTIATLMHDDHEDDEEDFSASTPSHPAFGSSFGSAVKTEGEGGVKKKKRKLGIFETAADGGDHAVDYSGFCTSAPAKKSKDKGEEKESGAVDLTAEDEGVKIKTEEARIIDSGDDDDGFVLGTPVQGAPRLTSVQLLYEESSATVHLLTDIQSIRLETSQSTNANSTLDAPGSTTTSGSTTISESTTTSTPVDSVTSSVSTTSSTFAAQTPLPTVDTPCKKVKIALDESQKLSAPDGKARVSAELAYECLHTIPFNQSAAAALMQSMRPYLEWQSTTSYLKNPPKEYAEKVQAPYDFWSHFDAVESNVAHGSYASEYDFGWDLYQLTAQAHDGHFNYIPDSVGVFTFGRTTALVSVSEDGKSLPLVYAYADILESQAGNASFRPSEIVQIDGKNTTDFLLDWSQYGTLQDRDALWNALFYVPAQVSLGAEGSGTGSFTGNGRGRFVYPGPRTTLVFANGTNVTSENFAQSMMSFKEIYSGQDIYKKFIPRDRDYLTALDIIQQKEKSKHAPPSESELEDDENFVPIKGTLNDSVFAAGYPNPINRTSGNLNAGYFLEEPGYQDVAVLTVASFVGSMGSEVAFQDVNTEFIAAALAANKTKLVIDVSANGGGTILQGYDLFKQLFPTIHPYGGGRFRAHETIDRMGQVYSEGARPYNRSESQKSNVMDATLSTWNYRSDLDVNDRPFSSWEAKYGPHQHGPGNDSFTSIIRWDLQDPMIRHQSGGIDVSGYGKRTNVSTVQPFETENIILVYDGYCASTCAIFSEFMRQEAGVKTIALGGRPSLNPMQGVGGVKGSNVYPWRAMWQEVRGAFHLADEDLRKELNKTALGRYTQLPLARAAAASANTRDAIRKGDEDATPLQFVYEATECRIFYTPAMVVDQSAVWKTVADTVWGTGNACVVGSNKFYGSNEFEAGVPATENVQAVQRVHGIREDFDIEEAWKGLEVETGEDWGRRGDCVMMP